MNPSTVAARAGAQRGWIEFRQTLTSTEVIGFVWPWALALVVLYVLRDRTVPGTDFSLGSQSIHGLLGMNVVLTGMLGMSMALLVEREDGTLLRAKAIPNGMLGYLTGKVVSQAVMTAAMLVVVLVPAAFLFDGLELSAASSWLTLVWVLVLGLVATLPLGAVTGSLFPDMKAASFATLLIIGLVAVSGVFYPITALPVWLQLIGQAFPVYWLALGMRSALLPDALSTAEIGGSWRHLETVAALGAWAVIGFVVAPVVLRRIARRATGSTIARESNR
ncbi:ABC transporter permease [Pseudonocardia nigra]|uniref:ABC transporter permease n=1 Tax=Pseudonocardia nigra TaxID=1921578 RepID=UPI001C5DE911|nr:ABC transporter permease [Pseudonocardia nigra]